MLNQNEVNKRLWKICDNFKNKTEIKKNYIVYISLLLFLKYSMSESEFSIIYKEKSNYYIADIIDEISENFIKRQNDKNLFSNIKFKTIKTYRALGEVSIITKTIEEIFSLSYDISDKKSIAKAYDYILEQAVYRNDIIKSIGEFHTPTEIANVMVNLIINKDNINVYDPICGSGNLLVTAAEHHNVHIYGKENNLDYYNILKTRMLLNEIDSSNIIYGNDSTIEKVKADIIISNPPFADRTWKDNAMLKDTVFNYNSLQFIVGDYIYVLNMLDELNENGKMAVILPHGVLFRENEKRIRERLISGNFIESIIGLPENLFYGTRIPVIIMIISKNRKEENVLFIDASQDYESDRKNNILLDEYQEKIISTYKNKSNIEDYSYLASKNEIIKNGFDLTIKKYIQKKAQFEIVDKIQLNQNVKKLKLEQERLEENIKDVLEALGYADIGESQIIKEVDKKNKKEFHNKYKEHLKGDGNINYNLIGANIKEARIRRKMTQEELAEIMEVSVAFLARIERGASQINLKRLIQICQILNISENEILNIK